MTSSADWRRGVYATAEAAETSVASVVTGEASLLRWGRRGQMLHFLRFISTPQNPTRILTLEGQWNVTLFAAV